MPAAPERHHADTVDIVRRCYDAIADGYLAAVRVARSGDPRDAWLELLTSRLPDGAHVLDAGCGPGVPTAAMLARRGYDVHGIDVSSRQIDLARAQVPGATFAVADVVNYDGVDPRSLDAIVALYSLTHVPRDEYPQVFGSFARWLR